MFENSYHVDLLKLFFILVNLDDCFISNCSSTIDVHYRTFYVDCLYNPMFKFSLMTDSQVLNLAHIIHRITNLSAYKKRENILQEHMQ